MGLRIAGEFITRKELTDAISAPNVSAALGSAILEYTVAVDERRTPRAHGFFIEVDGDGVGQSVFTVIIIYSSSFMPTLTALSFIPTGPNAHLALIILNTVLYPWYQL